MRYHLLILTLIAWLPKVASANPASEVPPAPVFRIECKMAGDLTAQSTGGETVFSIQNSGIGRAIITRIDAQWPQIITLRIHLKGLESLTISNGKTEWSASVSSGNEHRIVQHLRLDGKEGPPLAKNSPHWAAIRCLGADGKPVNGLPPAGGWFELRIPPPLLTHSERLDLAWIDFYR